MILLNPLFIFFITWIPVLIYLIFNGHHGYIFNLSDGISIFILLNLLILLILNCIFTSNSTYSRSVFLKKFSIKKFKVFKKITIILFLIWIVGFILNVILSGGFPLLWLLTGDSRNYLDFGIPTFSGLLNMLRCFLSTAVVFLLFKDTKNRYFYLLILSCLILSLSLLELSRGNTLFLLLHVFTAFILFRKKNAFKLLRNLLLLIIFGLPIFYIMKLVRTSEGLESLLSDEVVIFMIIEPFLNYISYPLINLSLYFKDIVYFNFEPNLTLAGFVPSFIRDIFIEPGNYGKLENESFNTSTFYSPFFIDYGVLNTLVIVSIIYAFCYLILFYVNKNSVFAVFLYPSLVSSFYLSIFSLYFTSLVVLLYPFIVLLFLLMISKFTFKIIK